MSWKAILILLFLPVLQTGCLPLLVTEAKTQSPGEFSLAFAGQARSSSLTAGYAQAGPATGVVELRAGLPPDRLEAGLTAEAPWNLDSDLKIQAIRESTFVPAVSAQGRLGLFQPSYGGRVLLSKSSGPATLTLLWGRGRTGERVWPAGSGPLANDAESFIKTADEAGLGIDWRVTPVHSILLGVVRWTVVDQEEIPRNATVLGVSEGTSWFFSAGLRIRWSPPPAVRAPAVTTALTALRGYILRRVSADRFEVGQPGIYRATVLLDAYTVVTEGGKPAAAEALQEGRSILIQGIGLPQPSTFLARTIELQ